MYQEFKTGKEGELTLMLPEDFHSLFPEEPGAGNNFAAKDEEKHVTVNVTWKKVPAIFRLFGFDAKKAAKNTERGMKKVIEKRGGSDYSLTGEEETEIGGIPAKGFRCTYTAQGISMTAVYLLLIRNREFYAFILLGRTEKAEENEAVFRELLENVKFSE